MTQFNSQVNKVTIKGDNILLNIVDSEIDNYIISLNNVDNLSEEQAIAKYENKFIGGRGQRKGAFINMYDNPIGFQKKENEVAEGDLFDLIDNVLLRKIEEKQVTNKDTNEKEIVHIFKVMTDSKYSIAIKIKNCRNIKFYEQLINKDKLVFKNILISEFNNKKYYTLDLNDSKSKIMTMTKPTNTNSK